MGSAQSLLSPEAAVTTVVVVGAIGYGIGYQASKEKVNESVGKENKSTTGKKSSRKNKKEEAGAGAVSATTTPIVVPFPAVLPGQFEDEAGSASGSGIEASGSATAKKNKSKKKKKTDSGQQVQSIVTEEKTTAAPPEQLSTSEPGPQKSAKKSKKKKAAGTPTTSQSQELTTNTKGSSSLHQSTISVDTDGEWTRVEARPKKSVQKSSALSPESAQAAAASVSDSVSVSTGEAPTTDGDGDAEDEEEEDDQEVNSSQGQRRPLAERMLPKPRKTRVEDMLETPDHPSLSRVMRIQPKPDEKPAAGFSWGDYEDVVQAPAPSGGETGTGEDDDDGWGVVKRGGRARPERPATLTSSSSSQHGPAKTTESMTKKQRQNARKREQAKADKQDQEAQRLEMLAKHKRNLEAEKIKEQYSKKGSGKDMSGGMKAAVDAHGKLVWE